MHESEKSPTILERTYEAPAQRIWAALTEPQRMRDWYFPMIDDFRPEVGFVTQFSVLHPESGTEYRHRWTVTAAEPERLIAYDWKYPGYPGLGNVRFDLEEIAGKTKLGLTFSVLESFDPERFPELSMANFQHGWTHFLSAIGDYLNN